jgi:hypothetical protein
LGTLPITLYCSYPVLCLEIFPLNAILPCWHLFSNYQKIFYQKALWKKWPYSIIKRYKDVHNKKMVVFNTQQLKIYVFFQQKKPQIAGIFI